MCGRMQSVYTQRTVDAHTVYVHTHTQTQLCKAFKGQTVDPSTSKRSGLHLSVTEDWRCILIQLR